MIRSTILAGFLGISLWPCALADDPVPNSSFLENGKLWTLRSLEEKPINLSKPLTFKFENGRVSVSGAVNRLSATYTRNGDKLIFGPVMSTRMAGDPALMELEASLSKVLASVNELRENPEELHLLSEGKIVARLGAQESN
jgi:heat shock protein HslJ